MRHEEETREDDRLLELLAGLPRAAAPSAASVERVRVRCRSMLAKRRRRVSVRADRGLRRRFLDGVLVFGCLVYLAVAIGEALRLVH